MQPRSRSHGILFLAVSGFTAICPSVAVGLAYTPQTIHDVDLLENDHLLVSDGGPPGGSVSGVYEIDRQGEIIWSLTNGLDWVHNADLQSDGTLIVSDTGNDRVIVVDRVGTVLWDSDLITLSDGSTLDYPNDANLLPDGNRLITDRDNHRVLEIDASGTIVWQFGETGVAGNDATHLNGPHNADRLASGNTIIADSNNHRILEITPGGAIAWAYGGNLDWPRDADRLPNGNTLINDSRNRRILEIDIGGAVVWEYGTPALSYDADRLDSGHTFVGAGSQILEVDASGAIVWSYPEVYETETLAGYFVTAPNGNRLWTRIIQPRADLYPGESFPAVVEVPGGLGAGETGVIGLAADGFIEFHFNAEGRGMLHPSEGEEDCNGYIHQADLKAVIEYAAAQPNVDGTNLGVVTNSYGITMAAGCLGRFPDLPVKYLVDVEGPSDSFVTSLEPWSLDADPSNDRVESAYEMFGHYSIDRDSSQANVDWWSEREATRYIGTMTCAYLRMQAEWDHAQPPNATAPGFDYPPVWYPCKHAVDLVNLAATGDAVWTRVNDELIGNPPGATYSREDPPAYYPGALHDVPGAKLRAIKELAAMSFAPSSGQPPSRSAPAFALGPAVPNPCSPATRLVFSLPSTERVELAVFDPGGRLVRTLACSSYPAGDHRIAWNGRDARGRPAPSGVYTVRMIGEGLKGPVVVASCKVTLLR